MFVWRRYLSPNKVNTGIFDTPVLLVEVPRDTEDPVCKRKHKGAAWNAVGNTTAQTPYYGN